MNLSENMEILAASLQEELQEVSHFENLVQVTRTAFEKVQVMRKDDKRYVQSSNEMMYKFEEAMEEYLVAETEAALLKNLDTLEEREFQELAEINLQMEGDQLNRELKQVREEIAEENEKMIDISKRSEASIEDLNKLLVESRTEEEKMRQFLTQIENKMENRPTRVLKEDEFFEKIEKLHEEKKVLEDELSRKNGQLQEVEKQKMKEKENLEQSTRQVDELKQELHRKTRDLTSLEEEIESCKMSCEIGQLGVFISDVQFGPNNTLVIQINSDFTQEKQELNFEFPKQWTFTAQLTETTCEGRLDPDQLLSISDLVDNFFVFDIPVFQKLENVDLKVKIRYIQSRLFPTLVQIAHRIESLACNLALAIVLNKWSYRICDTAGSRCQINFLPCFKFACETYEDRGKEVYSQILVCEVSETEFCRFQLLWNYQLVRLAGSVFVTDSVDNCLEELKLVEVTIVELSPEIGKYLPYEAREYLINSQKLPLSEFLSYFSSH